MKNMLIKKINEQIDLINSDIEKKNSSLILFQKFKKNVKNILELSDIENRVGLNQYNTSQDKVYLWLIWINNNAKSSKKLIELLKSRKMTQWVYEKLQNSFVADELILKLNIQERLSHPELNYSWRWSKILILTESELAAFSLDNDLNDERIEHFTSQEVEEFISDHISYEHWIELNDPFSWDYCWGRWDEILFLSDDKVNTMSVSVRWRIRTGINDWVWVYWWGSAFIKLKAM